MWKIVDLYAIAGHYLTSEQYFRLLEFCASVIKSMDIL